MLTKIIVVSSSNNYFIPIKILILDILFYYISDFHIVFLDGR